MKNPDKIGFDDSLPILVNAIVEYFGRTELENGLFVRDSTGRLRFLSSSDSPSFNDIPELEEKIAARLGSYARPDGVIGFRDEPGVARLLADPAAFPLKVDSYQIRLLDRRIVGSAWVEARFPPLATPPRVVFASLKGGVGRSTALAITAADMARRNRNVLIFDLDLEAPGVGGMLLDDERLPLLGSVDFLVENGLGGVDDRDLHNYVGTSTLTHPGGGRVDVVPAFGRKAIDNPGNTLAKLSRAMIEDIDADGKCISVPAQMQRMVDRFASRVSYDAVLIDSRAGLSELTAPAVISLAATVLFFGTAQRQTLQGYAALFAAIKLLAQRDLKMERTADWRLQFKPVLGKAGLDSETLEWYRDEMYEIFAENLYDEEDMQDPAPDSLNFGIDDQDAPHWPLLIPFDSTLTSFDPVRTPSQLELPFYERTFRPFLDSLDSLMAPDGDLLSNPGDNA